METHERILLARLYGTGGLVKPQLATTADETTALDSLMAHGDITTTQRYGRTVYMLTMEGAERTQFIEESMGSIT